MTLDEYQANAVRTLHAEADSVYLASKLVIEAAEVAQPIIKERYHGKPIDNGDLIEELGDVLWYAASLAWSMGLSLDGIAAANIEKLRARHGEKYNPAHYQTAGPE